MTKLLDHFTLAHWARNPWYMWAMMMLISISVAALIFGEAVTTIMAKLDMRVVMELALANLLGTSVVLFGLHLKNWRLGINLELAGAVSLLVTLLWYTAVMIYSHLIHGTPVGFGLLQAFLMLAMTHRCVQIMTLKWARWRGNDALERKVTSALSAGIEDVSGDD